MKITYGKLILGIVLTVITILDVWWIVVNGNPYLGNAGINVLVGISIAVNIIILFILLGMSIAELWDKPIKF